MQVILTPGAKKNLNKLHKVPQILIIERLKKLGINPKTSGVEKLVGYKNAYRLRVGNYRVVYRIIAPKLYIVLIGHRKDVYEKLKRLL